MIDPNISYEDLFYSDYSGVRWTDPGETRVVTWSYTNDVLEVPFGDDAVSQRDIVPYLPEMERAFDLWDAALTSIDFVRTDEGNAADVTLAVTDIDGRGGIWGYWNASWTSLMFDRATIQFDVSDIATISVVTIALHEIGNILGLGDIRPSFSYRSVQEDPIPETFTGSQLWDDDLALIRRYYSEDVDAPLEQTIDGGEGNDMLVGGAGNDLVLAGAGTDGYRLPDAIDGYALSLLADGTMVLSDLGRGVSGRDALTSVEVLEFDGGNVWFSEGRVNLDELTGIADLSQAQIGKFAEMYIAYFDRAPDAIGLYYWGTRLSEGMTLEEIAESFFVQDETRALYPADLDNRALVQQAYNNFLERDPDTDGWDYWTGELNAGFSRGKFMLALINGARDNDDPEARRDVATIEAKADIGLHFAAIHGLTDVDDARAAMRAYDRDEAGSLSEAMALSEEFAAAAKTAGAGQEFSFSLVGIVDDPSVGLV